MCLRVYRRHPHHGFYRRRASPKLGTGSATTGISGNVSEETDFLLPSVAYLGHIITQEGLHTEETKVCAIVDAPEPTNVGELRSFLGMVNYYGKFLPDLATTLAPLYHLLRKSCHWRWGTKQKEAFSQVKDLLRSGRVLTHFDDRLPLVLACDASPYGLGAVLSHLLPNGEERLFLV